MFTKKMTTYFRPMAALAMELTVELATRVRAPPSATSLRGSRADHRADDGDEATPLLASSDAVNDDRANDSAIAPVVVVSSRGDALALDPTVDFAALAAVMPSPPPSMKAAWRMRMRSVASKPSGPPLQAIDEGAVIAIDHAEEDRLLRQRAPQLAFLCFQEFDIDDEEDDSGDEEDIDDDEEEDGVDDDSDGSDAEAADDSDDEAADDQDRGVVGDGDDSDDNAADDQDDGVAKSVRGVDEIDDDEDRGVHDEYLGVDDSVDGEKETDADEGRVVDDGDDDGIVPGGSADATINSVLDDDTDVLVVADGHDAGEVPDALAERAESPEGMIAEPTVVGAGLADDRDTHDDVSENVTGHHVLRVANVVSVAVSRLDRTSVSSARSNDSTLSISGLSSSMVGGSDPARTQVRPRMRYDHIKAKVNSHNNKPTPPCRTSEYALKAAITKADLLKQNHEQRRRLAMVAPKVESYNHIGAVKRESPTPFETRFQCMQPKMEHENRRTRRQLSQVRATMSTQPTAQSTSVRSCTSSVGSSVASCASSRSRVRVAEQAVQQRENVEMRQRLSQVQAVTNSHRMSMRASVTPRASSSSSVTRRSTPSLTDPSIRQANLELRARMKRVTAVIDSNNRCAPCSS